MKKTVKSAAVILCFLLLVTATACGGKGKGNAGGNGGSGGGISETVSGNGNPSDNGGAGNGGGAGGGNENGAGNGGGVSASRGNSKTLEVWLASTNSTVSILRDMEKKFNDTVGAKNGFKVHFTTRSAGFESQISSQLAQGTVDIAEINDKVAKGYIKPGYLLNLDKYVKDGTIKISDMTASSVNRFRLNAKTGDVGASQPLYAVPRDNTPTALFYNASALKKLNINIISVAESDLNAYNGKNGTHYLPHGFYEYSSSPAPGLKQSNIGGVKSFRVFNDCIPMNWDELLTLSEYLTKSYNGDSPTTYGYYSEWWFNYGWSVGGDCLENGADGSLKFTLCDNTPNYLVTKAANVNGRPYNPGEILSYADKLVAIKNNKNDISSKTLYELPSQYDAFSMFCALSQAEGKQVNNAGVKGYGVSPNPTRLGNTSRAAVLTTQLSAIVAAELGEAATVKSTMKTRKLEWGIAPFAQYREYNADGTLKRVNGTPVTGLAVAHSLQSALAASAKTAYPKECAIFIGWWVSEEAQSMLLNSGVCLSCLNSLNKKASSQTAVRNAVGAQNITPLLSIAEHVNQGDWSYVENGDWITDWANDLNTDVRNGGKTVDAFWSQWEKKTDSYLKSHYTTKKFR